MSSFIVYTFLLNFEAPAHSMWSDGSAQSNTNFAADSGLDGGHCCVKVEAVPVTNVSKWKGEKCSTILHGICEFRVEGDTRFCSIGL